MKKDTFYFTHDFNARQDEKIKRLIRKHNMHGYGIFWAIVEDLYNNANALETDYEGIAFDYHTDVNTIKSIIHDFDLFVFEDTTFGSISIERRLNERNAKSAKASQSAHLRWERHRENANAMQTHSECNAIKESKGNEIKESIYPTIEQVIEYFTANGYSKEIAAKAFNYYSVANWKDVNGKQVKSWKQKMQSVWFKPENKVSESKYFIKPDGSIDYYRNADGTLIRIF